jgi:phage shock protein C
VLKSPNPDSSQVSSLPYLAAVAIHHRLADQPADSGRHTARLKQAWSTCWQPLAREAEQWDGGAMAGTRKLYRSRSNRKLAGVCGGLATYFTVDPTLVRVLFVVLAVAGGPGILAYVLLWILVPEEPQGPPSPAP